MTALEPAKRLIDVRPRCLAETLIWSPSTPPVHPHHRELGQRHFMLGRELWIERYGFLSPIGSIIRQEARWCSTASRA